MFEEIFDDIIAFFLTEFPTSSANTVVEAIAKEHLVSRYSTEVIDEFWEGFGQRVIDTLVEEFNRRSASGEALRYEPVDDIGEKVRGRAAGPEHLTSFQDALLKISDKDFEALSARVLSWIGCSASWSTPSSHDEGLDAFGVLKIRLRLDLPEVDDDQLPLWMLVQAKHYLKEKVRPANLRELAGSTLLARFRTYASVKPKYTQLVLRPLGAAGAIMITSGEVTADARGLARRSGIVMLTTSDVFAIYSAYRSRLRKALPASVQGFAQSLRAEARRVQIAA